MVCLENHYLEVLDTMGAWRCVRFESGHVGVVDNQGKKMLELGNYQDLKFVEHGFLRVLDGKEFFIDMKNGALYTQLPEFVRFGDFELAHICGFLCTRTKRLYEVQAIPADAWHGKQGLYLSLPYKGELLEKIKRKMVSTPSRYLVCLLNGDESGVYWKMQVFEDYSLLVMDDMGNYFHARNSARSRMAVKEHLGRVVNEADKAMIIHAVRAIEEQVADQLRKEAMKVRREAEQEREKQIAMLVSAEPFQIGNKWGLRNKGRIVVPPIYRAIKQPVGRYCAFELHPKQWGVMAVDGKIEVEPRYEEVELHADGTADLTVRHGKVIVMRLGIRN